jgi:hypothetical protein
VLQAIPGKPYTLFLQSQCEFECGNDRPIRSARAREGALPVTSSAALFSRNPPRHNRLLYRTVPGSLPSPILVMPHFFMTRSDGSNDG